MEPNPINDRTRYAFQFFRQRGYSQAAAAGIVGNLMVESGGFSEDVITGKRRGDNGTAFGIAQHRHERLANMESFAQKQGKPITDFETQLAFVDHEMRAGLDGGAAKAFRILQDPGITGTRAAAIFMQNFERPHADPSVNHIAKRQAFAMQLLGLPPQPDMQVPAINSALPHANNPGDYTVNKQSQTPFNSVSPILNSTSMELHQEEKRREEEAAGLMEGAGIAIKNNWSVLTPFRTLGHHDPDPSFVMDDERIKRYGERIPSQYLDEFEDAVSDRHAEAIRTRLLKQLDDNQKLADMGWTGTALNVGAAITDPGAIAAAVAIGAATGGLGGAAIIGARARMATRIALGAAEGAAANAITEVPLIAVDPTRDASSGELGFAIGSGLLFGGAFGALSRNPQMTEVADRIEALGRSLQNSTALSAGSSAGAARTMVKEPISEAAQNLLDDFRDIDPKGKFLGVRFDAVGSLLSSKNPVVRGLAQFMGEDGVRSAKGEVTHISATERAQRMFRVSQAKFTFAFDDAFKKYRKANGINAWNSRPAEGEFKTKVIDYLREENPTIKDTFAPEVVQAASAFKTEMDRFWQMAKEAGITRSEMGVKNYVPRYANLRKANELISTYGIDGVSNLYKAAIKDVQRNIDDELAGKLGKAIVMRMQTNASGESFMGMGRLGLDMDNFEEELGSFLSANDIANVKAAMKGHSKPDGSGSPNLKHRISLNENFSGQLRSKHGTVEEVNISDFYLKDPIAAFSVYSRNMSGQIAMAKMNIPVEGFRDGIKSRADWDRLVAKVQETGLASGANNKADLKNLNFLYSAVTGTPLPGIDRGSDFNTFLRMMRDFNFIRLMGQVGFSQLPEFGRVTAQAGVSTMFQAVPSFRHFIDMVRAGKMTDDLAEEIQMTFAPGTDYSRTAFFVDADDFGVPVTQGADSMMQKVAGAAQPKLHSATRFVNTMSGMRHVNQTLQQWAARASAVKFTKMAMFGDKVEMHRMKALGLSEDEARGIFEEIKTHARFKDGVKKPSKLEALGLDKWKPGTRAHFEDAIFRMNRTMVLENDPGQMHRWMGHPLGQMLMQFRSFVTGSWTKATLQGLNMKDQAAVGGFVNGALIGTLVYAAQQYVNTRLDPDGDKKLKEKMTFANLGAAAFARTSESSILPMLIDTPIYMATNKSLFDVRGSGQRTDMLANPTFDLLNTGKDALNGITSAAAGDDYSRPDFNNLRRVLPFQNMMGVTQFMNWIGGGLPKRELRD